MATEKRRPGRKKKEQILLEESAHFVNIGVDSVSSPASIQELPITEGDVKYEIIRTYDEITPKERDVRRNVLVKNVSTFNTQMLKRRVERGPFYLDAHTKTTQVISSWMVDVVYSEDFRQKQRQVQEEQIRRNIERQMELHDVSMNIPKPKKPSTPFSKFLKKYRRQELTPLPPSEMQKNATAAWKELPEEKKRKYNQKAEHSREKRGAHQAEYEEAVHTTKKAFIDRITNSILNGTNVDFDRLDYNLPGPATKMSYEISPQHAEEKRRKKELIRILKREKCSACHHCVHQPPRLLSDDDVIIIEEIQISPPAPHLKCCACQKFFHWQCVMTQEQFEAIPDKNQWRDCQPCMRCFAAISDPAHIPVVCESCGLQAHGKCLQFPLEKPPKDRWLCPNCVRCTSCGTRRPDKPGVDKVKWCKNYTLCHECHLNQKHGQFCPICSKTYDDSETAPMVCCDGCDKWIHAACDGISETQYNEMVNSTAHYYCPSCREKATTTGKRKASGGEKKGSKKKK
ncbi:hypothetical protein PROFUN_04504 [Planoprotostelium fungivorum]|uniref:Uncharacterized protein n=1 Tax=Planoprotostelium fungivorum TaxID=1890364 RepID=A0A2P6NBE5_9EUKA|nr:hypothetical protein PROFUN_04504 [Planoprotostelium fungivorum]